MLLFGMRSFFLLSLAIEIVINFYRAFYDYR